LPSNELFVEINVNLQVAPLGGAGIKFAIKEIAELIAALPSIIPERTPNPDSLKHHQQGFDG